MKKHFLIAATAAAFLLPSLSSAILAAPREKVAEHQQLEAEHAAAFTDARIAALKAGLKLTSAQEKNWSALETTLREVAKDRATRTAEWNEKAKEHHEKRDLIEGFSSARNIFQPAAANWKRSRMRPSPSMTISMTHRNIASAFFCTRSSSIPTTTCVGACTPMNTRTKILIPNPKSDLSSMNHIGTVPDQ